MENELSILETEKIKSLIYTIRGKQVMLDSDVAMLYHYETKRINEAVRRNPERFPEDFCFQLNNEELKQMWSQNATILEKIDKYRTKKAMPYVFTEQGIAMLSGLLKNDVAIQVSINIMNAFVNMRKYLTVNRQYPVLKVIKTNKFHDRFIMIDDCELYHCGASIKDLGGKCFAISKIENNDFINLLQKAI